jgi:CHAT domain-containing protein
VPYLGDARLVFIVPEASLHQVSFAALPLASGQYLVEDGWRIHYLGAERDLVPDGAEVPHGSGLLAMGIADFGAPETEERLAASGGTRGLGCQPEEETTRVPRTRSGALAGFVFPELEWAEEEARQVVALWAQADASDAGAVTLLTGAEGTETRFKKEARGKRTLHLATHGFFLGAERRSEIPDSRGIRPAPPGGPTNPMQLSGLAFTGANARDEASLDQDNGILLSEEVAALNLQGVELAVLSACETALGRVLHGEGVQGLRSAFTTAGVKSLVMSLWRVAERPTEEWMAAFYEARFVRELALSDAVHEATLRSLESRRRRHESAHPFYWGAFVATGDWR